MTTDALASTEAVRIPPKVLVEARDALGLVHRRGLAFEHLSHEDRMTVARALGAFGYYVTLMENSR